MTIRERLAHCALAANIIDAKTAEALLETTDRGALVDFHRYMTVFTDEGTVKRLLHEWRIPESIDKQ